MLRGGSRQVCRTANGLFARIARIRITAIPAKAGGSHLINWIPPVQKYKYNWLSY